MNAIAPTLTIYGRPNSRASRCLWTLEELALPYRHVPLDHVRGETRTDAYLELEPAGKIPALRDGDLILSESCAICLHLARRYGNGRLWPTDENAQSLVLQWSFWFATELEPPAAALVDELILHSDPTLRDSARIDRARARARRALERLELGLQGRPWLLGSEFGVADILGASICKWLKGVRFELAPHACVSDWLSRCLERPAYKRVLELKQRS